MSFCISTYTIDLMRYNIKVMFEKYILFHIQNDMKYPLVQFGGLKRLNVGKVFSCFVRIIV